MAGCASSDLFTLPAKSSFPVQLFSHPFEPWIQGTHSPEIFVLYQFGFGPLPHHKIFKVKGILLFQFQKVRYSQANIRRYVSFSP
jgi:hypothetical protein